MNEVRRELERIYAARGTLTCEIVVEEARDAAAALHGRFEWDDAAAGAAYRLGQAGALIRSVRIGYSTGGGEARSVRGFVSARVADERPAAYEPTLEVVADPFRRKVLLNQFRRDWRLFQARYEGLAEFVDIVLGDLGGEGGGAAVEVA